MLKLRPAQFDSIGRRHLVDRAVEHLKRNQADFAALDPRVTRLFVEESVRQAMDTYRMEECRSVMTFVLVAWFLGPDFIEKFPEADVILRNPKGGEADHTEHLYRWAWKQLGKEPS